MKRYSNELGDCIFVKGYGFWFFVKNMGKNIGKSLSKYSQKLSDNAKEFATYSLKNTSIRVIQKTAEATCNLIGNKIADKIASTALQINPETTSQTDKKLIEMPKERYISSGKRQQNNDDLRLT